MSRKIATLDSLRDEPQHDDNEQPRNESFFVGGGRTSGQQVLGPDSDANGDDEGARIMRAAQQSGAEVINLQDEGNSSSSSFGSAGYRLGGHGQPSERLNLSQTGGTQSVSQPQVSIHLWNDGFSIDDGPLRTFSDESSRQFMQAVMQGRIPEELIAKYGNQINVQMQQKGTDFVPPKPKPFSGQGHQVGGGTPRDEDSNNIGAPLGREEALRLLDEAQANVRLNPSAPTTRLQIRFPNNERMIASFNLTHTVDDVRSFVVTANPNFAYRGFMLASGFPIKPIANETVTLKDAGLINAVVMIRFI